MPGVPGISGCALSCLVVNVNGLRRRSKRRALFQRLRDLHYSLVILCETHSKNDVETTAWAQEGAGPGLPWDGQAFWHHGTSASRGVAVLVRAGLPISNAKVSYKDASGRILMVRFNSEEGHPWAILGVYGPVETADRGQFYSESLREAMEARPQGSSMLVAGDFNCVTSQLDLHTTQASPAQNSRLVGGDSLQGVQVEQGLMDVWRQQHPHTQEYTRTTHSANQTVSSGRTSRWLISQEIWDAQWVISCAHAYGQVPGDHAAVVLNLKPPQEPLRGKRSWVFPTYLLGVQEFLERMTEHIQDYLAQPPPGIGAMDLWSDLKCSIKQYTLSYSYSRAADLRRERGNLEQAVHGARVAFQQNPACPAAASAVQQAVHALQQHDEAQSVRHGQTLDALWGAYGEQSTMWFHRLGREVKDTQPIRLVKNPAGGAPADLATVAGVNQAKGLLADFFDGSIPTGLFHPAAVDVAAQDVLLQALDSTLDATAQAACVGPAPDGRLTDKCLQAALAASPKGTMPGCDGLPYEFYQTFWALLEGPMLAAFNEAFLSTDASPQLSELSRTGLVILLYKEGGKPRDDPDSYRPITLLNCDVKLVAKVLVLRMGQALDTVIDITQTAFVPGRWIGDNVLFHLEELDYVQATQSSACIVGLDYNKAYDRIHRGWLSRCMEALGIPAAARRWVALLLAGTRGLVVFNGWTSRAFPISAGCAQGSPLSPLLYVISAQPLAAMCRKMQREGRISAIMLPTGLPAPPMHQHADDTTIHLATAADIQTVLNEVVHPFCRASGAQVSLPKSWGLTLGSHPPIVGAHGPTGIVFKPPLEFVRHLGIPLSPAHAPAAVDGLYQSKLRAICGRIRHWSRHDLSLLGRAHVAKQVLASTLSYHATFLPPPPALLAKITRVLSGYVLRGQLVEEGGSPLRGRPSKLVMSLPVDMGGIALVDLEAHTQALRAKVLAMLLHPKWLPWKALMASSFSRAFPGLGLAVCVQHSPTGRLPTVLTARHGAYLQAFRQLGIHRRVLHGNMTKEQVALEPLVGNHSVATQAGLAYPTSASLPLALRGLSLLRQVSVGSLALLKLPATWLAKLTGPSVCPWAVDIPGSYVRRLGVGQPQYFRVMATKELCRLPAAPAVSTWQPACVVDTPHPSDPDAVMHYLVGAWDRIDVDPSVWCLGSATVLTYEVKLATARIIQWHCRHAPGWTAGAGIRPKLWGETAGLGPALVSAVADIASRQKRRFEEAVAAAGGSGVGRAPMAAADLAPIYHAPWFDPSPPRLHVRQRVESRAAVVTQQRLEQDAQQAAILFPLLDDTLDPVRAPVTDGAAADPLWCKAWRRAFHKRVPRTTRVFAWRLLHGALPCGSATVVFFPPGDPGLQGTRCCNPGCTTGAVRPLETLQHLFMECTPAKGALQWLCELWSLIDPTHQPPPFLPHVLLADDPTSWSPPQNLTSLWGLLRLTMLKRIWLARCAIVAEDNRASHASTPAIVCAFVQEIRSLILQDWLRVEGDVRQLGGVCPSWFRGRDPSLSLQRFQAWWCAEGVLATTQPVPGAARPRLLLKLSRLSVPSMPL